MAVAVDDQQLEARTKQAQLRVIRDVSQLPAYGRTLSDRGEECELREQLHRYVALIELIADGTDEPSCALVWVNRLDRAPRSAAIDARTLAHQKGWKVRQQFEAGEDVIRMLYRSEWARPVRITPIDETAAQRKLMAWMSEGLHKHASDIHLQVLEDRGQLLYRVHGDLMVQETMRREEAEQLSEASFWMARGDSKGPAFDRSSPQDAALQRTVRLPDGTDIETKARWASVPTEGGWDIVMRLLPRGRAGQEKTLKSLGYSEAHIAAFERMQGRPTGLIGMVGTTGSGKSTTLQTLVASYIRKHQGRKLVRTIEDPVEYHIPGARQSSVVRRGSGDGQDDFAALLKATLRGDPDGLMVGECRDELTARLVQRASQTGHKVWTTLHAGSTFDAIDRFNDLGIQRAVLGSGEFLSGIIFQRLLPVLCEACREPWSVGHAFLPRDQVERIERAFGDDTARLHLRGRERECSRCKGQGVTGRTVAAEMLVPDRTLNQFILRGDMLSARAYWRAGMVAVPDNIRETVGMTALEHAMGKALGGWVSPDDIEQELGLIDELPDRERDRQFVLTHHPELEIREY